MVWSLKHKLYYLHFFFWQKHVLSSQTDGFTGDKFLGRVDLAASLQCAEKTLTFWQVDSQIFECIGGVLVPGKPE